MARHFTDQDYELLSSYLDDMLPDAERSTLEARLNQEPALRQELEALRTTVALVKALPPVKAPRSFALDARTARRPVVRWLGFPATGAVSALTAAAAVLLLALGLASLLGQGIAPSAPPPAAMTAADIAALPTQIVEQAAPGDGEPTMEALAGAALTVTPTDEPMLLFSASEDETSAALDGFSTVLAPAAALPESAVELATAPPDAAPTKTAPAAEAARSAQMPTALAPTGRPLPTASPMPAFAATAAPTVQPASAAPPASTDTIIALTALAIGGALLIVAAGTTLARRRGRP